MINNVTWRFYYYRTKNAAWAAASKASVYNVLFRNTDLWDVSDELTLKASTTC